MVLELFAENSRSVKPVVEALGNMADFAYNEANKPDSDLFGGVPSASRREVIDRLKGPNERTSAQTLENGRRGIAASSNGEETALVGSGQEDSGSNQKSRPTEEDSLGFSLESQTPQDLEARQAALDKAKADEAKAETKAQVDKQVDSFALTGSDSQVDQAEAAGQNKLFDKPKDAPAHGPGNFRRPLKIRKRLGSSISV